MFYKMTVKQRVEHILGTSKSARNSDKELQIIYMQESGMRLSLEQLETFRLMPLMETIRRERQKLQEQGSYPADEVVENARFKKYKYVKQRIKGEDAEQLLEGQGYKILPW